MSLEEPEDLGEPVDLWERGSQLEKEEVDTEMSMLIALIRQIKIVPFIKAMVKSNGGAGQGWQLSPSFFWMLCQSDTAMSRQAETPALGELTFWLGKQTTKRVSKKSIQ